MWNLVWLEVINMTIKHVCILNEKNILYCNIFTWSQRKYCRLCEIIFRHSYIYADKQILLSESMPIINSETLGHRQSLHDKFLVVLYVQNAQYEG
jgi:hypothetical protein